jgi:hypothetical protein
LATDEICKWTNKLTCRNWSSWNHTYNLTTKIYLVIMVKNNNNVFINKLTLDLSGIKFCIIVVAILLWESVRMRLTLPKWGLGNPPRLPKVQSLITMVKTPRIEAFSISLESYQILDVENGLAWVIWTSATLVMAKKKVGSQTGSLTPDRGKSGIDPIPLRAGGVRHAVGKLSTRATTLV